MKTSLCIASAIAVMSLGSASWTRAEARGICNVHNVGPKRLQDLTMAAGSHFFIAGSSLWLMFSAVEAGDMDQARANGRVAREGFRRAAGLYKEAMSLVDSTTNKSLAKVDVVDAAKLAMIPSTAPEIKEMGELIKAGKGARLMEICSEISMSLERKTEAAQNRLNEDGVLWELMREWNAGTFRGRFISSLFSLAGKR